MTRISIVIPVLLLICLPKAGAGFTDSDRWGVIGDSTVHNGTWHVWVQAYYLTRFPDTNLDVLNCGISGDTVAGALRRYEWDIKSKSPTVATVMFGANDVSRGLYHSRLADTNNQPQKEAALARYENNLAILLKKLLEDGISPVLVTPAIFDDVVEGEVDKHPGVNAALGECTRIMHELGASLDVKVIDIHTPMNALNQRLQSADSSFSLMGRDRVHAPASGHLAMAYFFLKGNEALAEVSYIEIDGRALRVSESRKANVSNLSVIENGLAFEVLEEALPYPTDEDARLALEWVPLTHDLNQQIISISGLADGTYELYIDGESIHHFTSEELAKGVNLAVYETPQMKQANTVLSLIKSRHWFIANRFRIAAQVEHREYTDSPPPQAIDELLARANERIKEFKEGNHSQAAYFTRVYERYIAARPELEKAAQEVVNMDRKIRTEARPISRTYEIRKRSEG